MKSQVLLAWLSVPFSSETICQLAILEFENPRWFTNPIVFNIFYFSNSYWFRLGRQPGVILMVITMKCKEEFPDFLGFFAINITFPLET